MSDDLRMIFLPRFTALARSRITQAIEVANRRDLGATSTTLRDLHALVGEAGLLGLTEIVPYARETEAKARRVYDTREDDHVEELLTALNELASAVERVAAETAK
jgi:HPt (histidine-containing phosphotransfer) domain-containing protein